MSVDNVCLSFKISKHGGPKIRLFLITCIFYWKQYIAISFHRRAYQTCKLCVM